MSSSIIFTVVERELDVTEEIINRQKGTPPVRYTCSRITVNMDARTYVVRLTQYVGGKVVTSKSHEAVPISDLEKLSRSTGFPGLRLVHQNLSVLQLLSGALLTYNYETPHVLWDVGKQQWQTIKSGESLVVSAAAKPLQIGQAEQLLCPPILPEHLPSAFFPNCNIGALMEVTQQDAITILTQDGELATQEGGENFVVFRFFNRDIDMMFDGRITYNDDFRPTFARVHRGNDTYGIAVNSSVDEADISQIGKKLIQQVM